VSKYVRISIYKQIKEKAKKRQLIIESLKVKVAEQDKRIAEIEKTEPLLQKVLDCCDGLHCEYTQANYGDAKNWLRHISDAYADYQDSIDLSKGGDL
jgi:hypothetical protein